MPARQRPRLYARDDSGRRLDVLFRPAEVATGGGFPLGPAPLEEAVHPGADGLVRVVVSRGPFSRADVRWASGQSGIHLLDGRRLQRWAEGATLDDLGLRS